MKNLLFILLLLVPAFFLLTGCQQELLVECESFENHGGWVVDPQFVEQMDSPYLMAHGMGEPVENASTKVDFPKRGTYHVWARTKDWAPGNWEAPGRFNLLLDDVQLEKTMGNYRGWGWNYAGKVHVDNSPALLEIEDLTGFNARCDAIYFNKRYRAPTNQIDFLSEFRDRLTGNTKIPETTMDFDLVVVGGGIAGCAASIAALADEQKRHRNMEGYPNIRLFLEYRAFSAQTNDFTIASVDARHTSTGEKIRFLAPYFIDCTGAAVGYAASICHRLDCSPRDVYQEHLDEYMGLVLTSN